MEGIKKANETLIGATDRHNEQVLAVYANFVEEWSCAVIDDNLVGPLLSFYHHDNNPCFFKIETLSYRVSRAVDSTRESISLSFVCSYQNTWPARRWGDSASEGTSVHIPRG